MLLDGLSIDAIVMDMFDTLQQFLLKINITTVMFVPNSKRSLIVNKLKEREDEMANITGFRIKYQEAGGTQLARMFSTDLARDLPCGRNECWPCNSTQEGKIKNCRARSVLYETSCKVCNPDTEDASSMTSPQEGNSNPTTTGRGNTVADPSPHPKGRVGIYLGGN